jgi:hypothetical protein
MIEGGHSQALALFYLKMVKMWTWRELQIKNNDCWNYSAIKSALRPLIIPNEGK